MKKYIFAILVVAALSLFIASSMGARRAGLTYHEVQVWDEDGAKVTDISSVYIYDPDTTTSSTIYSDSELNNAITLPMTSSSTNTTLSNGSFSWWGPDGWDFSITDGTSTNANANHRTRTSSEGRLSFPTYLQIMAARSTTDDQTWCWGGTDDVASQWINGSNALRFTPLADGSHFDIGVSGTTKNMDFRVYTGAGVGFLIDEGLSTLTVTGLTTSINAGSNYVTNINTGTSTAAVNIGSSTSGAITVDSASTATYNSDAATSITTTDAGADITVNSLLGRVIIEGEEDAANAVHLMADGSTTSTMTLTAVTGTSVTEGAASLELNSTVGGVGMRSTANLANAINITADSGTATSITVFNDTGTSTTEKAASMQFTSDVGSIELWSGLNAADAVNIMVDGSTSSGITIFNDTGTGASSIYLLSDVGGIAATASAGSVTLTATGSVLGGLVFSAGNDYALTTTDDATLTIGDDYTVTVSGNADFAVTGSTTFDEINYERETYIAAGGSTTVTAAMSGTVFLNTAADGRTDFVLPTAVAGYTYTFIDISSTAADDVRFKASSGDKITAGGTAADWCVNDSDESYAFIQIVAVDAQYWHIISGSGTWDVN